MASSLPESIVFGTPERGWPPFHIPKGDKSTTGIMIDVLREACAPLGVQIIVKYLPEKRIVKELDAGTVDVFCKARAWVAVPNRYQWSAPVVESTDLLVMRKDKAFTFNQITDLYGRRIGTVLGYRYPRLSMPFSKGLIVRQDARDPRMQMQMTHRGRVEASIINMHVAKWIIKNESGMSIDDFVFSATPLNTAPYRFMLTPAKDMATFIDALNKQLQRMKADGRMERIFAKYR